MQGKPCYLTLRDKMWYETGSYLIVIMSIVNRLDLLEKKSHFKATVFRNV